MTNTRFERSTVADALGERELRYKGGTRRRPVEQLDDDLPSRAVPCEPGSFHRVVSVGSRQFLAAGDNGAGSPTRIYGSFISGWGERGGTLDAISMPLNRGPYSIVDTVFDAPVDEGSCALGLSPGNAGALSAVILSNVTRTGGGSCVLNRSSTAQAHTYAVPPGAAAWALPSLGPNTTFFRSFWPRGSASVIDAVIDFGADRTGRVDASSALQACVDTAAASSNATVAVECYVPVGTYTLNSTLRLCGSGFVFAGSGWYSHLQQGSGLGPAPMIIAGPGAGCAASNFTLRSIKMLTSQGASQLPDFVLSRTSTVPASRVGKFPAFSLPGGGNATGAVTVSLDAVYFQSDSGYVVNGLEAGDAVTGTFWDGNPSFFDCGDALLFPQYLSLNFGRAEVGRPMTAAVPAVGFLGAAMLTSASVHGDGYDLSVFNSTSLVAQDWYSEAPFGNSRLFGSASDAPGRFVVGAAKVNTNAGYAALAVDGYSGLVMQTGANVAYQRWNVTLRGEVPVDIVLLGSTVWVAGVDLTDTNAAGNVSFIGNIASNNTWDGWIPDSLEQGALVTAAAGFDAFRELGAWDIKVYFPGGFGNTADGE